MTYADGFVPVRHSFLVDSRYTAAERLVLIWLASKPEDWDVRLDQVCAELNLGRDAAKRILRDLRQKSALTKPSPARKSGGTWARHSGRLAIRPEVRHVSAGRTGRRETGIRSPGLYTKESGTNESTSPAESGRTYVSVDDSEPSALRPPLRPSAVESDAIPSELRPPGHLVSSSAAFSPPCHRCGSRHAGKCKSFPVCWTCARQHPLGECSPGVA